MEEEWVHYPFSVQAFIDDFQWFAFLYQLQVLFVQFSFLAYLGEGLVNIVCLYIAADAGPASTIGADSVAPS